jgi:hypothetical protein
VPGVRGPAKPPAAVSRFLAPDRSMDNHHSAYHRGRVPRSPVAGGAAAQRADVEGPHPHSDRSPGRGAQYVAARNARGRAELGLPVYVGARFHVRAVPVIPQPRLRPLLRRRSLIQRSIGWKPNLMERPVKHITKADGTHATALLDDNFTVSATEDHGQGGPGGGGSHGPGGIDGDAGDSGGSTTSPSLSPSGSSS